MVRVHLNGLFCVRKTLLDEASKSVLERLLAETFHLLATKQANCQRQESRVSKSLMLKI